MPAAVYRPSPPSFRPIPKSLSFNPTKILNESSPTPLHSSPTLKTLTLTLTLNQSKPTTITATASHSSSLFPPPSLKSRLRNGETLYGIFLCSFSPTLAEIAGLAGYDFAVIDMEHGFGGIKESLDCLRALDATSTPAILRLPERSGTLAKKALDLGPEGLMFPMIEGKEEAEKAVEYCRYPPNGVRGAAHPIVRASGYGIDAEYVESVEEELLIMCQVESLKGMERIEEIAGVDGVDCIQMGPLDLSASMGYLWDPGNKKVRDMMRLSEEGVKKSRGKGGGAYLAGFALPFDTPPDLKARGYQMVSGAVDVGLFRAAAVEDVNRFRMSLEEESSDDDGAEGKKDDEEKYWS
ncbi:hypothetical protein Drorol1_Dr00012099 [Drosera rotundifolia]